MAVKSKVISTSKPKAVTGGKGHMFGKQSSGTQKPGQTTQAGRGTAKFAKGGAGHMFGKQSAVPAKAGRAGK